MRKILVLTIEEIKETILYDTRSKGYKPKKLNHEKFKQTAVVELIVHDISNIEAHIEVENLNI